jgi:hypothetical protein
LCVCVCLVGRCGAVAGERDGRFLGRGGSLGLLAGRCPISRGFSGRGCLLTSSGCGRCNGRGIGGRVGGRALLGGDNTPLVGVNGPVDVVGLRRSLDARELDLDKVHTPLHNGKQEADRVVVRGTRAWRSSRRCIRCLWCCGGAHIGPLVQPLRLIHPSSKAAEANGAGTGSLGHGVAGVRDALVSLDDGVVVVSVADKVSVEHRAGHVEEVWKVR